MRLHQQSIDRITVRFAPRYAEATFAVFIATFLTVPPLLAALPHFSEAEKNVTDFGLLGAILFLVILAVPFTVVVLCTFWFLHCIFPRQFDLSPEEICFKGVPGAGFTTATSNIKSILIVTHQHRRRWLCHVSLELYTVKAHRNICVNYDPICHPAQVRAHRGLDQAKWLIDVHRPLADLLASILNKPVKLRHNVSKWNSLYVSWP